MPSFHEDKTNFNSKKGDPFFGFISNMDQLFSGKPFGGVLQSMDDFFQASAKNRSFPINIREDAHHYTVTAQLPGISRQQIMIESLPQAIQITIKQNEHSEEKHTKKGYMKSKLVSGVQSRTVRFVQPINQSGIQAEHKNGLLQIHVPKITGKSIQIRE